MLDMQVQDLYQSIVDRVHSLDKEIEEKINIAYYEGGKHTDEIFSDIGADFSSYFSDHKEVFYLGDEIIKNLRIVERDSREFLYLKELNSLFSRIDVLPELVKDEWKENLMFTYEDDLGDGYTTDYVRNMVDEIRNCINMLRLARIHASDKLCNSHFVHQHQDEFTYIIYPYNEHKFNSSQSNKKAEIKQKGQNIKLRWGSTKDSLYDLFAQLSLLNGNNETPLLDNTIEGIARFLSEHVEDMPSYETIERRLRTFREPNGERPKRNRIEIDIRKNNS